METTTIKLTVDDAVNIYYTTRKIASLSEDRSYRELLKENANKIFYGLSLVMKKAKDYYDAYTESEKQLTNTLGKPFYSKSDKHLDEKGNPQIVLAGYIYGTNNDKFNEELKNIGEQEAELSGVYKFRVSEIKPILSANDYLTLSPLLEFDVDLFEEGKANNK